MLRGISKRFKGFVNSKVLYKFQVQLELPPTSDIYTCNWTNFQEKKRAEQVRTQVSEVTNPDIKSLMDHTSCVTLGLLFNLSVCLVFSSEKNEAKWDFKQNLIWSSFTALRSAV